MMKSSIDLGKLIAPLIGTREAAKIIEEKAIENGCTEIILDFKNVEFISRSFACALLRTKKKLEKQNLTVKFINMNNDVEQILKIAEKHIDTPPKKERVVFVEDDMLLKLVNS